MLTPRERDITAVVLCGGLGTRLREVLPNKPKVLAEINGVPFIYYLLRKIEKTGCRNVILCTGYLAEQVESLLGNKYRELTIVYAKEFNPMGNDFNKITLIGKNKQENWSKMSKKNI